MSINIKNFSKFTPEYAPPLNMEPALIGSFFRGRCDGVDNIASIINLAEKGYLNIKEIKKNDEIDYQFELLRNDILGLGKIERSVLNFYFKNNLAIGNKIIFSDFMNNFARKKIVILNTSISKEIYNEMVEKNFYKNNPNKAEKPYLITAFILALVSLSVSLFNLILTAGIVFIGIIVIMIGLSRIKKTKFGNETLIHINNFKFFLSASKEESVSFTGAPEKSSDLFMKFLPYAIALGVEQAWEKQFGGIKIQQPDWYHGDVSNFVFKDFIFNLNLISTRPFLPSN